MIPRLLMLTVFYRYGLLPMWPHSVALPDPFVHMLTITPSTTCKPCVYRPNCAIRTSYLCETRNCTTTSPRRQSISCAMLPWLLQGDTTQVGTKMPRACLSICFLACWLLSSACAVCPLCVHVGFNISQWHHQVWLQSRVGTKHSTRFKQAQVFSRPEDR